MNIYAISDLHLSFCSIPDPPDWNVREYKPMSEIDRGWTGHARKIYDNWVRKVKEEDIVLLPGDISWAMKLEEAEPDICYLGMLPGRIVAVQGNHDYWWQSISRVRSKMPPNVSLIQNDCVFYDGWQYAVPGVGFAQTVLFLVKRMKRYTGESLSGWKTPLNMPVPGLKE